MEKLYKTFIFGLLIFSITNLSAQEYQLKTTTEDFNEGKITYQYYENKNTLEWVKHGNFKFIKSLKSGIGNSIGTHNTIITGHFKDGFRDGTWNFSIKEVDFPNGGNSYTTEITTAIQTFKDGMPNGIWTVNSKQKYRNKYFNIWRPFTTFNNVSAKTIFHNGFASGPSTYTKNGVTKTLLLSSKGFITSNIIVKGPYDNTELYINKHGIMTKHVERSILPGKTVTITNYDADNIKTTEDFLDQKISPEEFAHYSFEFKIVNLSNVLDDSGLGEIFEHDYFLLRTLGGDKSYDPNSRSSQSNRHYGAYIYVSETKKD